MMRSARVTSTALGAPAEELITFPEETYPELDRVLLHAWADRDEPTEIYQPSEAGA